MAKIVFIDLAENFYDRHAVYTLSSVLKARNHEVYYMPKTKMKYRQILDRLKKIRPDLLLYSSFTVDIPQYAQFDKLVKEQIKVKSLIGGHGPTYEPERVLKTSIDALCMGEGETALIDYVDNDFVGQKNIIDRVKFNENNEVIESTFYPFLNLDDSPIPARSIVYEQDIVLREQPSKQFMAGRGCPYQCTYCFNHVFNQKFKESGPIVRYKSVDYLIEEIRQVKNHYPLKTVVFQDDVFILRKKWLMEFCERFPREIGLPFTCNIKPEIVVREEIVKALKQGGCIHAAWSIESGNDCLRNKVLKRNVTKEQLLQASSNLNKYKISHRVGNMIGIPGEKFDNILETIELNIKAKPNLAISSIFVPFPGLELTNYAIKHNYLDKENTKCLPYTLYRKSILNFAARENINIQKITYLFPLLIRFPFLYYNKSIFYKGLLHLPRLFLRIVYDLFFIVKMAGFFKIKTSIRMKLAMLRRYFSVQKVL